MIYILIKIRWIVSRERAHRFLTAFLIAVLTVSCVSSSTDAEHKIPVSQKQLIVVGGGEPKEEIRLTLLEYSSVEDPEVLVIPHAAREENRESSGQRNMEIFKELGVRQVTMLDLTYIDKALEDIADTDVIWISGGSQSRLMQVLKDRARGALITAIREKSESGIPIGGSSAGAAVMSEMMISSSYRDEDTGLLTPRISQGLGLWPKVIVDQHFSERSRLERLEIAVRKHPDLTGVGIDERTAVVYDENRDRFHVIGDGTVTVIRRSDSDSTETEFEKLVLKAGDSYKFGNTITP